MADLNVTIGADATAFNRGMQDVVSSAKGASNAVSGALSDAAMKTDKLGGSALSASMQFQQMRSGMSAARDGALAFAVGGQRADMMLMAMGHHITTLVSETGSLGGAFKSMGQSLLGIGGVILAITLAFEIYEKTTKKAKETTEDYVSTLNSVRQATLKGQQDGQAEITRLQVLYKATQDHTLSLKDRNLAYDALETKYPTLFTNAQREQTLLGENATMYEKLAASILSAAAAKAYENQIGTNSNRIFENQQKGNDLLKEQASLQKQIATAQQNVKQSNSRISPSGATAGVASTNTFDPEVINRATQALEKNKQAVEDLNKDTQKLNQQNSDLAKMAQSSEQKAGFSQDPGTGKDATKEALTQFELLEQKASDLKLQLENAFLANAKPTIVTQISEQLAAVSNQLDKIKKQFEDNNYLLTARGAELLQSSNPTGSFKKNNKAIGGSEINGVGIEDTGISSDEGAKTITNMQAEIKLFNEKSALIRKSQSDQKDYNVELKEEQKIGQDLIKTFGGGLQAAFQSALSGTQNFVTAMGQFLTQLIEKLAAAAAAAEVLSLVLGIVTGGTSIAAKLGMTASQSSFTGLFGQLAGIGGIGKHASGGIFTQAHVGMFGEAGPEAIVTPKHLQDFAGVSGGGNQKVQIEPFMIGASMWFKQTVRTNKSIGRTS